MVETIIPHVAIHTLTFSRESLMACWDECVPLFDQHRQEMVIDPRRRFSPDREQYRRGEASGVFRLYTARNTDGAIVGYTCAVVFPSLLFFGEYEAGVHVLWLHPAYRMGWNGIRLIRFCERELKEEGVTFATLHALIGKREGRLFRKLGWTPTHEELHKLL